MWFNPLVFLLWLTSGPLSLLLDMICLLRYPLCERRSPVWCQGHFLAAPPPPPSRILALQISSLCVPELVSYFLAPWGVRNSAFRHIFCGLNHLRIGIFLKSGRSVGHHWDQWLIHPSGDIDLGCSSFNLTTMAASQRRLSDLHYSIIPETVQGQIWVTHFLDLCLLTPPPNIWGNL